MSPFFSFEIFAISLRVPFLFVMHVSQRVNVCITKCRSLCSIRRLSVVCVGCMCRRVSMHIYIAMCRSLCIRRLKHISHAYVLVLDPSLCQVTPPSRNSIDARVGVNCDANSDTCSSTAKGNGCVNVTHPGAPCHNGQAVSLVLCSAHTMTRLLQIAVCFTLTVTAQPHCS